MELRYSASEICCEPPSKEVIEKLIQKQVDWREAEFRLRMAAIFVVVIALTLVALLSNSWMVLIVSMGVGFFVYMAAVLKAGFLASSWHDASLQIDENEMFKHYIDIVEIGYEDLMQMTPSQSAGPANEYIQRVKAQRDSFFTLDLFIVDYLIQSAQAAAEQQD